MGNKASLFITLDNGNERAIVAGNSLKGKVVLNVQRKLPPGELVLRLVGTEYTIIPTRKGTRQVKFLLECSWVGNISTTYLSLTNFFINISFHHRREERTIARAFTQLKNFGGSRKIAKGLYSQPFEFLLPPSLPSSTQFPKSEGKYFHGRIQYRLSAEMGDLVVDRIFDVISAPLGDNIVPCIAEPTTYELKQARVLRKGYLSVGACVDNSHVGRGQTMRVSLSARNDSSCDIDRIRVKLTEIIEYKAGDESHLCKNELVEIKDVHLPLLQRSRSQDNLRLRKKKTRDDMATTYSEILNDLRSGNNTFKLTIPKSARDSYNGNLMTISHVLKITFYTGGMTVENPSTKIAIVVGSPRCNDLTGIVQRNADAIATIVGEDPLPSEVPDPCDDSTVSVGGEIPMAEARILPPFVNSPNRYPIDGNNSLRPARILPYNDEDYEDYERQFLPSPMPIPSAPHESLLDAGNQRTRQREGTRIDAPLGGSANPSHRYQPQPYAPNAMYSRSNPIRDRERFDSTADGSDLESSAESSYGQEQLRNRFDSYSYGETTAMSDLTDLHERPQLGHAEVLPYDKPKSSKELFQKLLRELRASIHDYEVISNKTREADYRELYASLTPKDYGLLISTVSMSYQVQVAVLLARQLVYSSSFTCCHCAEAVNKTSTYFRTNMVEALIPYVHDLAINRNLIESELTDWERCVTARAFENLK
ncbi:arrestin or S-antigen, C-terminal domain containing protein [Nitzschia inconspicua]|uniref:Arrestin or S-antigen, C-terminal domain containing protein n=1 Tax=Nitzschia inconspicua TaxID=303405 RepID=A0A9K3PXD8_9STRA|nr:arrestin or S-antigen, C-terminal domain containing protein [Nitzschia inconspicua]